MTHGQAKEFRLARSPRQSCRIWTFSKADFLSEQMHDKARLAALVTCIIIRANQRRRQQTSVTDSLVRELEGVGQTIGDLAITRKATQYSLNRVNMIDQLGQ